MVKAKGAKRVPLTFKDEASFARVSDPIHEDLSAAARAGDCLFLSCDETAGVERLTPLPDGGWGNHVHFNLGHLFDLPDGPTGEMDIEGLAVDDGWLWIVGSHSLKRDRPKREGRAAGDALARMRDIDRDPNRYFLGRVPLGPDATGALAPRAHVDGKSAQAIRLKKKKSTLQCWLAEEPLLQPSFAIPSKENGFDIEGIAVRGDRVWLGLRGPVLRGHAVVVELNMKTTRTGRLKACRIDGDRRYRLHLLAAGGLGVRELTNDGADILVLTGPTMSTDGPARILRWRDATRDTAGGVVRDGRLETVQELPYRGGCDHPEGLEPWPEAGDRAFLVVHDAPAHDRLDRRRRTVWADIVTIPAR